MKVSLDHDVYKWLLQMGIVKVQQVKNTGKVEIDENQSNLFINGIKFGECLNKMLESKSIHIPFEMKNQQTPGVKLYNWNMLQDAFQKINLPLDNDIKNLIVQGDIEMMNELLKDMMEMDLQNRKQPSRSSVRSSGESSFDIQRKPPSRPKLPRFDNSDRDGRENELILEEVDIKKPLNECRSLLDFFITGLSRHLSLKPQQAASLLSNGNKYLAHLMVKGVKGEFETLINWLSEIYASLTRVFQFFEQQDSNIHYFFGTLKPGLLSKEQEITLWTLRIMGRTFFQLAEMELHQLGYEWFCRENGGLTATFMCMQRHPYLINQICELYSQVSRFNIIDFFTVQFKKILADKCIDVLNAFMEPMHQQKSLKDELLGQGVIKYWAQVALKMSDSEFLATKMQGLKFLTLNWILYPIQFEEDQNYPNQYLFLMKKGTRDTSTIMKYFSLENLFRLLDKLAIERNPFAAVLYKKLTFSLVENYSDIDLREFMIQQFMYLIQKYSTIPIDILLEPLIKQVMLSDALVNVIDMMLFKFICKHPKMKIKMAILLLDLLSKIYLNSVTMSHLAFNPMQVLLARFAESPLMREYTFKLCKIGLALHFGSIKSKKQQVRTNDLSILSVLQQQNNDQDILSQQKRSQIIEMIKFVINMQQDELNEQIKPVLCHFYLELRNINVRDKGIITLLNMFGNPEDIVQVFQEQWEQDEQNQLQQQQQQQILQYQENENEFVQPEQDTQQLPATPISQHDPFKELKAKEQEDEKSFLLQNGVGFKKRVVELERGRAPQTKKQRVDPKVLENIANIKLKKEEEILRKQQEEEEKRKRFELLQKKAQQEIKRAAPQKEQIIELIEYRDAQDQDSINVALKKYRKAIKYLFTKYSNTTNHASKKQYFEELQEQFDLIQFSDLIRMMKDYQVNIPKDELQAYMKAINQRYCEQKSNLQTLDQKNFERLLVQIAIRNQNSTYLTESSGTCLEEMLTQFGQVAKIKNENYIVFQDIDEIETKQIQPQQQTLIQAHQDDQNWIDCYEIVSSIFEEALQINLLEQQKSQKYITKQSEPSVSKRDPSQQKKIINRVIEEKLQKQQEEEIKKIEAEEKRKRHQEKLKQEYLRKKREKEELEELKKEQERQDLIDKVEKDKKQQELLKKEAEERKLKLREYKEKMAEENKLKDAQNIEIQRLKQEMERKQREEFSKKQKEEVSKALDQKKQQFQQKAQQAQIKEQKNKEELNIWKNNVETMLQQEAEQRSKEKQIQQKIYQLYQDPSIQTVYKQYEKQLQIIYHSYQEYTDWRIDNAIQEKDLLQFKGFTNFASQFSLYPTIITPEDASQIFKQIERARSEKQTQTKGLTYSEFQQALLRIAIKSEKYFNLLNDKYENNMKTIDMLALKKEEVFQSEPLEQQVEATSSNTLQGLMYFLDMPIDKGELNSKLRALKLEFQKVAAQRDKKQIVQQKLTEEPSIKRKQSVGPSPKQKRNISARQKSAQKIQPVQEDQLDPPQKIDTVGPNGQKESWQVE